MGRAVASSGDRRLGMLFVLALTIFGWFEARTIFGWFEASGCASPPKEMPAPSVTQKALIGKTKAELLACATGQPKTRTVCDLTVLRYYKEAFQFEESFSGSKSSVARLHHGCWASLVLKHDRVEGVQYDSIPSSHIEDDHCDEIFAQCVGP